MPIDHATAEVQFGSLLRIMRKRVALIDEIRVAGGTKDRALLVVANGFSTGATDESNVLGAMTTQLDNGSLQSMRRLFVAERGLIESKFFKMIADDLLASPADRSIPTVKYFYDTDVNGAVTIRERRGVLGAWRRAMVAAAENVLKNTVGFGAITALSGTRGVLAAGVNTGDSHAEAGKLRITVDSDNVTKPILKAVLEFTDPWPDGTIEIPFDQKFTTDRQVEDGPTGITLRLDRSGLAAPTEVLDADNLFATTSFVTPTEGDSDHGVFYFKVVRLASDVWQIEIYSDGSHEHKVGTPNAAVSGTSGTQVLTIPCKNGTVITTTFSKTNAHAAMPSVNDDATAQYDIETPRLGDEWEMAVTNDEASAWATKMKDMGWKISFPTVAAAPTYAEAAAASVSFS